MVKNSKTGQKRHEKKIKYSTLT